MCVCVTRPRRVDQHWTVSQSLSPPLLASTCTLPVVWSAQENTIVLWQIAVNLSDHRGLRCIAAYSESTVDQPIFNQLHIPTASMYTGGVTKPIVSVPLFSQFLRMLKTLATCMISRSYLTGVSSAVTPDKYENDWKYLTYNFVQSKFPVTERITNGDLVTPTQGLCSSLRISWPSIAARQASG